MKDYINTRLLLSYIIKKIRDKYDNQEGFLVAQYLIEFIWDISLAKIIIGVDVKYCAQEISILDSYIKRLRMNEPWQYLLNRAYFYDRYYYVDNRVLIPRPETEQLLIHAINRFAKKNDISVLDIGTGSGCIAITLFNHLVNPIVRAIDISQGAIEVAKKNSITHKSNISISNIDILKCNINDIPNHDLIVSNPPYVLESYMPFVSEKVKSYEPSMAIFVPDKEYLLFYRRLALLCSKKLVSKGRAFF